MSAVEGATAAIEVLGTSLYDLLKYFAIQ